MNKWAIILTCLNLDVKKLFLVSNMSEKRPLSFKKNGGCINKSTESVVILNLTYKETYIQGSKIKSGE